MIEKIVELLNEAAALDPAAIRLLVTHRQSCNDELAKHPSIVVGDVRGFGNGGHDSGFRASIGMVGLLNGLEPDKKRVAVIINDELAVPIRFEVATPKTHPKLFDSKT